MTRNIVIVLLVLALCLVLFTQCEFGNSQDAKIPDLKDAPEIERALTMAIIASSRTIAKEMVKELDKQNLTREAYSTFVKAARGMKSGGKGEEDPNKVYDVKLGDAPVRGSDDAPVTIVAFSEFQCPFCGRANKSIKELEDEYKGKVKVVFRSKLLPRHSKAPLAHAAAYAAGHQGKFWEMHDKIFDDQKNLTEEAYLKYASELGLNISKFKKDLHDEKIAEEWSDDEKESQRLGVTSTPTFFINGKKIRGAKPKETFKAAIEDALKQAKK